MIPEGPITLRAGERVVLTKYLDTEPFDEEYAVGTVVRDAYSVIRVEWDDPFLRADSLMRWVPIESLERVTP